MLVRAAASAHGAIVEAGKRGGILHDPCRLTSAHDRPLIFDRVHSHRDLTWTAWVAFGCPRAARKHKGRVKTLSGPSAGLGPSGERLRLINSAAARMRNPAFP